MKKDAAYNPQSVDVRQMFNDIAPKYDFLNHFLSAGSDKRWRKKTISMLRPYTPKQILDIATGTGDLALEGLSLNPEHITGIDISEEMMKIAEKKILLKKAQDKITFLKAGSENLPFPDNTFDAVTVAFGVRNFYNLEKGLSEIYRVIKTGGAAAILEFSVPASFPMKQAYMLYFKRILPLIGKTVSKNSMAYSYLPKTVLSFPQGKTFCAILEKQGFSKTSFIKLSSGICSVYLAEK